MLRGVYQSLKSFINAGISVLSVLIFDANPAHGLSKPEAENRCERCLQDIEKQQSTIKGDDLKSVCTKGIEKIRDTLSKIKKSPKPEEILSLNEDCHRAARSMQWLIDTFGALPNAPVVQPLILPKQEIAPVSPKKSKSKKGR
ncbi:MAG: hypothetical protein NTX76_03550 [Alphaproteobacteria bacterium]|nr:hypothetical protein [Alphaproteobacteria bacterium]